MELKEFLRKYEEYLIEAGITENSASSYKSYVRNVCAKLPGVGNHLEKIASETNSVIQSVYVEQMNAAVTDAIKNGNSIVDRKRLHDYKSAVAVLHAFVENLGWYKGNGAYIIPTLSVDSEYDLKDLRKVFISRLKTQDRMTYPYGVFAARILSRIASGHKVKLFDKVVDNIKILIGPAPDKCVKLKDIDKLTIATNGHVYVEVKGKTYSVYTENIKDGASDGYEKIKASSMRDLSLDHDIPLYHALQAALDQMPEYKKLSDSAKASYNADEKENASEFSKEYFDNEYPALKESIDEKKLLDEIGGFIDNTAVTIMYGPYNSSKSKNTP